MITINLCFKVGLNLSQVDLSRFVSELIGGEVRVVRVYGSFFSCALSVIVCCIRGNLR